MKGNQTPDFKTYHRAELDSRADTCCAGATFHVIEYTGQTYEVYPYNPSYKPKKNIPVVKAVTAYDMSSGETIILCLNQSLYFGKESDNALLNPNQMRANGVLVDDCPISLSHDNSSTHSIYFPDENVRLPLEMHGCISYLPTRLPTKSEIKSCRWIELTSDTPWDLYSDEFAYNESKARQEHISVNLIRSNKEDDATNYPVLQDISHVFGNKMMVNPLSIKSVTASKQKAELSAEELASRWGIGLQLAEQTLKVTTHKFIQSNVNLMERRYMTSQQQLCYRQLGGQHGRFYSDTMFTHLKSINNNACGQIFVNNIGFYHFMPMQRESEAHHALVEFIQHVGIPSALHSDGSKVQTKGDWLKTIKNYHIKTTVTEPHSPWQNRAEATIRELKRHTSRLMRTHNSPKRLWDYCCILVARIRNLMPNNYHLANGRTPHEFVTGDTPDTAEFLAFTWYQPVWYLDTASYPEEKRKIGHWLGVSHRVGQAMCFWVLTESAIAISHTSVHI